MTSDARATHPLIDFLLHLFLAIAVLALLAVGIVLMLIFTVIDAAARAVGRLRSARR